jgi:sigma-54 dependent transcriptional regulator, acetoin dehydrogenase operon transcriptional activator AcoR
LHDAGKRLKLNHRRVDRLRDQFENNLLNPECLQPWELTLTTEWARCKQIGIDSSLRASTVVPSRSLQVVSNRPEVTKLLEHAVPVITEAADHLTFAPVLLCLADANGVILRIIGNNRVRERAELVNIIEGGIWHEQVVGNNGIGTAIAKQGPVRVLSLEHYCEAWHKFSCAGTPITDQQGCVLGVIDITTLREDYCGDAVCLTHLLAGQVKSAIQLTEQQERFELVNHFVHHTTRYPGDLVVVVDKSGQVVSCSRSEQVGLVGKIWDDSVVSAYRLVQQAPLYRSDRPCLIGQILVYSPTKTTPSVQGGVKKYGGFLTLEGKIHSLFDQIKKAAGTLLPVIVCGETGTGKELVARHIHDESPCAAGPFIAVNCANLSKELYSSYFFGYDRGAFTGADSRGRKGYFEQAHGGTLFLDEFTELPPEIQAALLRVLEYKIYSRLGSEKVLKSSFRIIAATNRNLPDLLEKGRFRSDLYYRLSTFKFTLPPLRERPADLRFLVRHFTAAFCTAQGWDPPVISEPVLEALVGYNWPGNVRQLKNTVEYLVTLGGKTITPTDLPPEIKNPTAHPPAEEPEKCEGTCLEAQAIIVALKKHDKIYLVARELGISRSTLYRRFKQLGIEPDSFRSR